MSELLPCPFCGGAAQRCDIPADIEDDNAGASYIECSKCSACTALHFDRKENLERSWNDRDGTSALHIETARAEARREALREVLGRIADHTEARRAALANAKSLRDNEEVIAQTCALNELHFLDKAIRALLGDEEG